MEVGKIDVEGVVQSRVEDRGNNGGHVPEDELEENGARSEDWVMLVAFDAEEEEVRDGSNTLSREEAHFLRNEVDHANSDSEEAVVAHGDHRVADGSIHDDMVQEDGSSHMHFLLERGEGVNWQISVWFHRWMTFLGGRLGFWGCPLCSPLQATAHLCDFPLKEQHLPPWRERVFHRFDLLQSRW